MRPEIGKHKENIKGDAVVVFILQRPWPLKSAIGAWITWRLNIEKMKWIFNDMTRLSSPWAEAGLELFYFSTPKSFPSRFSPLRRLVLAKLVQGSGRKVIYNNFTIHGSGKKSKSIVNFKSEIILFCHLSKNRAHPSPQSGLLRKFTWFPLGPDQMKSPFATLV